MLDAHPDMAIPPETYFLGTFGRSRRRYERRWGFDTNKLAEDLLGHRWFRKWRLSEADLRAALTSPAPADFPDAVRRLFDLYARRKSKRRYGDKTPEYVMSIGLLARLFPEARFIHVIRDGRDVALSLLDVGFGPNTLAEAALTWKTRVARGRRAGRSLDRDRYREVRYESLMEDPEGTLRSVCAFIDLEYEEAMLRYYERPGVASDVGRPEQHHHIALPLTRGLRDWKRDMKRDELIQFEALAGGLLTSLGYERAYPRVSMAVRASAVQRQTRSMVRRANGRLRKIAVATVGGSSGGGVHRTHRESGVKR